MRVLVTGGAGYIGSHTVKELVLAGHEVTVVDNLVGGHREAVDDRADFFENDMADYLAVSRILREKKIEAVVHFAAFIEVAESIEDPFKYYRNNFSATLNLLEAMRETSVNKIVFSSTAAVYGVPNQVPIDEKQDRRPINPYGRSKMMTEMAIEDAAKAYGIGYAILRYFNVAGAAPDGSIGEAHEPESHLIPRILTAISTGRPIGIFGTDYPTPDGTCIRDYIHVVDLANAHLLALEKIISGAGEIYNLGSESGFSVRDVIAACRKITGLEVLTEEHPRRPGDPAALVASSTKIRSIGWVPRYPELETIIAHAWNWHRTHPKGYSVVRSDTEIPFQ